MGEGVNRWFFSTTDLLRGRLWKKDTTDGLGRRDKSLYKDAIEERGELLYGHIYTYEGQADCDFPFKTEIVMRPRVKYIHNTYTYT